MTASGAGSAGAARTRQWSGRYAADLVVPFGVEMRGGEAFAVDIRGGEIEVELEAGRGGFGDLAQRDLVDVVGGLFRGVEIVVLDAAIEVDEIGPAEDRLELVQDQAVLALGLVGASSSCLAGALGTVLRTGGAGILVVVGGGVAVEVGAQIRPERHGFEGVVVARGGQAGGIGAQGAGGFGERGGIAQRVPDERFDGGLPRGKSARGAQGERGVGETFVQAAQAGGGVERGAAHGLSGGDGGEVGAQRVGIGVGRGRHGRLRRRARDRARR